MSHPQLFLAFLVTFFVATTNATVAPSVYLDGTDIRRFKAYSNEGSSNSHGDSALGDSLDIPFGASNARRRIKMMGMGSDDAFVGRMHMAKSSASKKKEKKHKSTKSKSISKKKDVKENNKLSQSSRGKRSESTSKSSSKSQKHSKSTENSSSKSQQSYGKGSGKKTEKSSKSYDSSGKYGGKATMSKDTMSSKSTGKGSMQMNMQGDNIFLPKPSPQPTITTKAPSPSSSTPPQTGPNPTPTSAPLLPTPSFTGPTFRPMLSTSPSAGPDLTTPTVPSSGSNPTTSTSSTSLKPTATNSPSSGPNLTTPTVPSTGSNSSSIRTDSPSTSGGSPSAIIDPLPTVDTISCRDISEDGCAICGDGFCVSIPDAIFTFPGQPDSNCSALEDAAAQGLLPAGQCTVLPNLVRNLCGCTTKQVQPPPPPLSSQVPTPMQPLSMPSQTPTASMPPSMTAAPSGHDFFFCSVCGEGKVIANPGAFISLPNQDDISCSAIADLGVDGNIDVDQCNALLSIVEEACGCVPTYPPCLVCGVGFTITDPNGIVDFDGQPPFFCDQVVQAGFLGFLPPAQCVPTIPVVIEFCGCQEIGDPEPCDLCGEGFEVIDRSAIVSLPGHPNLTCAELSQGTGLTDPALCPFVLPFVVEACGCQAAGFPSCRVCGNGSLVSNQDALISIAGQPEISCGQLESEGKDGQINPAVCEGFVSSVEIACGCELDECQPFEPCDVCGKGKIVTNPDATLTFPGQQTFSCAEFAELGLLCRLDPAICRSTEQTVESICGCEDPRVPTAPSSPPSNPQPTPSPNDLQRVCTSDENGNFGNSSGGTEATVTYFYQVETMQSVLVGVVNNEIMDDLEVMISNAMISVLFAGSCGTSISRRLQQDGVIALSSIRRDEIIDGVCEGERVDSTNACFVVSGDATLFVTPEADIPSLTTAAQNAIRQSMNGGEMNDVDSRVIRVTYQTRTINEVGKGGGDIGSSTGTPIYVWILVAGVASVLVGVVVYFMRRRRMEPVEDGNFPEGRGNDDLSYVQDPANEISASVYPATSTRGSSNGAPDRGSEMDSLSQGNNSVYNNNGYQGGAGYNAGDGSGQFH